MGFGLGQWTGWLRCKGLMVWFWFRGLDGDVSGYRTKTVYWIHGRGWMRLEIVMITK